jgi:putative photosynthetic complex assembly protein
MADAPDMLLKPFPRPVLIAAAVIVGCSIALAATVRLSGMDISQPTGKAVTVREFRFADRHDGSIAVTDAAANNRVVEIIKPETGYFLRATMRTLARQRLREDIGEQPPFVLTGWNDGRLTLDDPTTGRRVDLEAFGESNEVVFGKLLMTPPSDSRVSAQIGNP